MEEGDAAFCNTCYEDLPNRRFVLSRRSEVVSMKHVDGKTVQAVQVIYDEIMLQFCCFPCWLSKEPEIVEVYDFKEIYPVFAWTASCAQCGKPINRTQPYVAFTRCDMEITEKPWLSVGKVFEGMELAIVCRACMKPTLPVEDVEGVDADNATSCRATMTGAEISY